MHDLTDNAYWAVEKAKHITKLRYKYWTHKILTLLGVLLLMGGAFWTGIDYGAGTMDDQTLSMVGGGWAFLSIMTFMASFSTERLRLQLADSGDKMNGW